MLTLVLFTPALKSHSSVSQQILAIHSISIEGQLSHSKTKHLSALNIYIKDCDCLILPRENQAAATKRIICATVKT